LTIANVGINAPYSKCARDRTERLVRSSSSNPDKNNASIPTNGLRMIQPSRPMRKLVPIHRRPERGSGQSKPPMVMLAPRRIAAGRY
jgi:hypothetical protein